MEKISLKILFLFLFFSVNSHAQEKDEKVHFGISADFLRMGLWGRGVFNSFTPSIHIEKKQHDIYLSPVVMQDMKLDFSYYDYPLFVVYLSGKKMQIGGLQLGYNLMFRNQDENKMKMGLNFSVVGLTGKESGVFTGEITPLNFGSDNYSWQYHSYTAMSGICFKWQPLKRISVHQYFGFSYTVFDSEFISEYHGKTDFDSEKGNLWVYGRLGLVLRIR